MAVNTGIFLRFPVAAETGAGCNFLRTIATINANVRTGSKTNE